MVRGATYYIAIFGYGSEFGAFQLNVTATDGSVVNTLPIKGRFALAPASSIASASVNGSASGAALRKLTKAALHTWFVTTSRQRHWHF